MHQTANNLCRTEKTPTFAAGSSESQSWVNLVFDLNKRIQHHRSAGVQIDLVFLEARLFRRLIRVLKHEKRNTGYDWWQSVTDDPVTMPDGKLYSFVKQGKIGVLTQR